MISIRRCAKPASLAKRDGRWVKEAKSVRDWLRRRKDPAMKYDGEEFLAYKEADVRDKLAKLFSFKCAYCESVWGATQPMAVEHYRPKNEVIDEVTKKRKYPGYPWLAYQWQNLLPSCTDCNSARYQETEDGEKLLGKANRFPLVNESKRAVNPGEEKREKPLLLNPCRDKVEAYFEFNEQGFVLPRKELKGKLDFRRADITIEVCGLYRSPLVNNRASHLRLILADIKSLQDLVDFLDAHPGVDGSALLAERIRKLKMYFEPLQPYQAMAHQFIDPAIRKIVGPGARTRAA